MHAMLALLAGCATSDGNYVITVGFEPPELAASAERVELAIMDRCADVPLGSVPADPLAQTTRERGRGAGAPWGANVAPGERALYGRALTASGTPFAAGCRAVRLAAGGGEIRLVLQCLPGSGVCTCSVGSVECSGACVDTASDVESCGSCGIACAQGEECTSGSCRAGLDGGPGTDAAPGVDAGPREPGDVVAFAAGRYVSCAVRADGSLWCWGDRHVGIMDAPRPSTRPLMVEGAGWREVAVGLNHACGRRYGIAFCWGSGTLGTEPGATTNVPARVVAPDTWTQITVNEYSVSCGIDAAHALWCWGVNSSGVLGVEIGINVTHTMPTRVDMQSWRQVSAGHRHACGVRDDGSLWCWGSGLGLGLGGFIESLVPADVGLRSVDQVSVGHNATCAISSNSLYCWGDLGSTGKAIATPTQIAGSWSRVSCERDHACAVRPDGTLWCWGRNDFGQLGLGPSRGLEPEPQQVEGTDWADVSAGQDTTCAVRTDRSLWCWGDNSAGQLGLGDEVARDVPARVAF